MQKRFDYGAHRPCVRCKGKAHLRSPVPAAPARAARKYFLKKFQLLHDEKGNLIRVVFFFFTEANEPEINKDGQSCSFYVYPCSSLVRFWMQFYTKIPCHNWYTPNPASINTDSPSMALRTWFPKRTACPKSSTTAKLSPIIAK